MATATKQSAVKPKTAAKKTAVKPTPKKSTAKPMALTKKTALKPAAKPAARPKKAVATSAKKVVAKPVPIKKATAKKTVAPTIKNVAVKAVAALKRPASKPAGKPVVAVKVTPKPIAKPALTRKTAHKPMPVTSQATKPTVKKPVKHKANADIISEAMLLKMSDKDYMNDAQLAFFKHRLQTMKDEMLDSARETGKHLKENEIFADPNDRATVEEENMLEQRVRDRERKLLKKIDSALRRIEDGEYGYCLETGEPIGLARLLARPTADLSIEAQEKHERLEKLYAD